MSNPLEDYLACIPYINSGKLRELFEGDIFMKVKGLDKFRQKSLIQQKKI